MRHETLNLLVFSDVNNLSHNIFSLHHNLYNSQVMAEHLLTFDAGRFGLGL